MDIGTWCVFNTYVKLTFRDLVFKRYSYKKETNMYHLYFEDGTVSLYSSYNFDRLKFLYGFN